MTADPGRFHSRPPLGGTTTYLCFSPSFAQERSTDEQMPSTLLDYSHPSTRRR